MSERRRQRPRPIDHNRELQLFVGEAAERINLEATDLRPDEKEVKVPAGMSLSEASVTLFLKPELFFCSLRFRDFFFFF